MKVRRSELLLRTPSGSNPPRASTMTASLRSSRSTPPIRSMMMFGSGVSAEASIPVRPASPSIRTIRVPIMDIPTAGVTWRPPSDQAQEMSRLYAVAEASPLAACSKRTCWLRSRSQAKRVKGAAQLALQILVVRVQGGDAFRWPARLRAARTGQDRFDCGAGGAARSEGHGSYGLILHPFRIA